MAAQLIGTRRRRIKGVAGCDGTHAQPRGDDPASWKIARARIWKSNAEARTGTHAAAAEAAALK
jgi:hypothetical protein